MAIFNEILVGRFNKTAQKLFAIKGKPPLRQLGGELLPVIDFDRLAVELRYLAGWRLWAFGVASAASVGNLGALRIRNPLASGILTIIEKVFLGNGSGGTSAFQLNKQFTTVDLATVGIAIPRDVRGGPPSTAASTSVPSFGNPAATAGGMLVPLTLPNNVNFDLITFEDEEIVLAPGDSITLYQTNVNLTANFSFFWRERPIEESETI